jgi:hypothetical protein
VITLEKLKNDTRFIFHASSQAQKATDYILNIRGREKGVDTPEQKQTVENKITRGILCEKLKQKYPRLQIIFVFWLLLSLPSE